MEPKKKNVGMVIANSKGGVVKGNKVYGHHDIGMQLTNNDGTEVSNNVVEDLQQAEEPQDSDSSSDPWYKKPIGMIGIGVATLRAIGHYFG